MLLQPQGGITYGPVRSRRLGSSLGINLLPAGRKLCNFDCLYCQYGWTDPSLAAVTAAAEFPQVDRVLEAVAARLHDLPETPRFLTFSGNGEPTLHPRFGDLVDGVAALRDRLAPAARTAILSNSSRVGIPEVRDALARLDVRIMKLDAGSETGFERYNRPAGGLGIDEICEGLSALPDTTLQALFTAGPAGNLAEEEIEAWLGRVASIRPRAVQIYSLDRGVPCDRIAPAAREQLEEIHSRLAALGVAADVYP